PERDLPASPASLATKAPDPTGRAEGRGSMAVSGASAVGAHAPVGHLDLGDGEAEPLGGGQIGQRVAAGVDVPDGAAARTHQVLVGAVGVRVVALGAAVGGHLDHLAERDELAEGVVDGRAGDLRQPGGGAREHLVRGEVNVLAVEYL